MELFNKQQVEMMEFLSKGLPPQSKWRYNPVTDRIDIEGDFFCEWTGLKDFRGIKFGRISGNFSCSGLGLTSLIGAPEEIGKSFNCSKNNLTSLEGAPKEVGYSFNCSKNFLESLEGGPEYVAGDYDCSSNKLVTLKGSPKDLDGGFHQKFICSNNLLKNLEGFGYPEFNGHFQCTRNLITSLEGAPINIEPFNSYSGKDYGTKISYYGNKGISGKALELIHITMIEKEVPYLIALGILKDQIKAGDLKKLIPESDNASEVIKGASMMSKFGSF
jgi:hypothetical protein